MFAHKGRI
uniref:Uncharacterized protein n=1 Tax=Anguilla anguilla TaxID=7936 RepID=A0A0E9S5C7_ANGAN